VADGTSFTIDIATRAAGVEPAAAAVARLGKELTEAAAAVKAGEAAYKQAENAADRAAKAVEKIGIAAQGASGSKLQNLLARQAEAAAKAQDATAAMNREAAALDRLRAAAGKAEGAQKKATQALNVQKLDAGSGKVNEIAEGFGKLGGPLGSVGQKVFGVAEGFKKMGASLGSAGPYVAVAVAIVAIATAVATVTVAAIAGIAAIASWAVGLADAARSSELLSDGIAKSSKGGRALDEAITDLEKSVPQTADELKAMAAQLAKTGLEGEDLRNELRRTAEEAALLKFGPDFAKGANTMLKLTERLKSNFSRIFAGLKIDKLLEAFADLVDLFGKGSESATAISTIFESLFQPLIDGLTNFIPMFISAFLQFEIFVMKAMIAIKPFGSTIEKVAEVFGILAIIVAAMTVGFFVAVITPFLIIIGLAALLVAAVMEVVGTFVDFATKLSGMSLSEIGTQMIQGLIDGIMGAGAGVLKAITSVVGGAIDGAKALLGISSPSKVFADIGANTAAGMEEGVDGGAAGVQSSLTSMVDPSAATGAAAAPAAAAGGGAIYQITIQAGGSDGESIADALRRVLADLGAQAGTAVPT
jgi:hypothetical protein